MKDVIYFSPLSRDLIKERVRKGNVGPKFEICGPKKRKKCDQHGICTAPIETRDPNCYTICRGLIGKEIYGKIVLKEERIEGSN